jgi:glycosyltransferase involved in cell wall biosynthesis
VPLILSVGRLVEKKGFDDLLEACAVVAGSGRKFRCEIHGEGPDRGQLESLRDRLGLRGTVEFFGARTQAELVPLFQRADVFALTPRLTDDGDRDGVPNVVLEAMACAKPVVSTRVGGIAEVVQDEANGLLIDGRNTAAIAAGIAELLDDPGLRARLGAHAAETAQSFDTKSAALRLAEVFSHDPPPPR